MNEKSKIEKGSEMYGNVAHNIYNENNVGIESPQKLVAMMYEGVLRFNAQAKKAIKDGNIEKKTYWINRSISIITELIAILDFKYGDITFYLEGLYNYQIRSLVHVNIEDDIQRLDEVSKVFKGLSDAWRDVTDVA
jgi:flagellar protein FliS